MHSNRRSNYQVLIIEDGDEYLTNLSTFVAEGFVYHQAKSGGAACQFIQHTQPDLVYLDMRFDRIPIEHLMGDIIALSTRFNGDVIRARSFQQEHQGLFILRALRTSAGYQGPVILSYDFRGEEQRFAVLSHKDPALTYCPDDANAQQIRVTMENALVLPGIENLAKDG